MRITFTTVETFLADLKAEREKVGSTVWHNQVRYRVDSIPEQKQEISFIVALTLTALIELSDGGQYIMECCCKCGCDDPEPMGDEAPDAGTQNALAMMKDVHRVAAELGLDVREGKLEAE